MTLIITMYDTNNNVIDELFADDWVSFAEIMKFYFCDKDYFRLEIIRY